MAGVVLVHALDIGPSTCRPGRVATSGGVDPPAIINSCEASVPEKADRQDVDRVLQALLGMHSGLSPERGTQTS
jgi:hypothetical protein